MGSKGCVCSEFTKDQIIIDLANDQIELHRAISNEKEILEDYLKSNNKKALNFINNKVIKKDSQMMIELLNKIEDNFYIITFHSNLEILEKRLINEKFANFPELKLIILNYFHLSKNNFDYNLQRKEFSNLEQYLDEKITKH